MVSDSPLSLINIESPPTQRPAADADLPDAYIPLGATAIMVTRFLMNRFVNAGATNIALYTRVKAEKEVQE